MNSNQEFYRLEQLLDSLTKEMFVWRMARNSDRKGSETRVRNALIRIDALITLYSQGGELTPESWRR